MSKPTAPPTLSSAMKRYGEPTTEIEFWIECELGHTTDREVKLVLDDEGNLVVQGVCEHGQLVREFFSLSELQFKARTIQKEILEL